MFKYESVTDNLIKHKCLSFNKKYSKRLNEELKKTIKSTFKFSNNDINKFILLLRKSVYPYEYLDDWEKFNEAILPEKKKEFFSNLNLETITDANYIHAKIICKDFEIRNIWDYHDLYLKRNTLLLATVFENFRDICLGIYELDTVKFISPPGLT